MRLFRKSEERIAREAGAEAEIARLKGLTIDELAVLVLPGLDGEGGGPEHYLRPQQVCEYLLRDFPDIGVMRPLQLMGRVGRSLVRLEEAGLVTSVSLERSPRWSITTLGASALADGTAAQRLAVPSSSSAG